MRAKPSADGTAADWTAASVEAAAVRLLARREHSRAELVRKLAARGAPAELVDEVLEALAARRLQSDARYAESLVTSRIGRGQGPVRIRRELAERGVGATLIETALEAAGTDWLRLARETRQRRFGAQAPGEWKERVRQARFLEYRGFSGEQIRYALGAGKGAGTLGRGPCCDAQWRVIGFVSGHDNCNGTLKPVSDPLYETRV